MPSTNIVAHTAPPVSRSLTPSSGLRGQQAHRWYTDHTGTNPCTYIFLSFKWQWLLKDFAFMTFGDRGTAGPGVCIASENG